MESRHGATTTPHHRLAGRAIGRHPASRHRRIRVLGHAGELGLAGRALPAGRQQRHGPQHPVRPRGPGSADASPHLGRARADRRRLPLLRPGPRRRVVAAAGRAAHDPPSVRPGRVRQRALVPPGREHAGGQHRHRRPGHDGQGRGGARPARGPGHGPGPPGPAGRRLPRGDHEADSPEPARWTRTRSS